MKLGGAFVHGQLSRQHFCLLSRDPREKRDRRLFEKLLHLVSVEGEHVLQGLNKLFLLVLAVAGQNEFIETFVVGNRVGAGYVPDRLPSPTVIGIS